VEVDSSHDISGTFAGYRFMQHAPKVNIDSVLPKINIIVDIGTYTTTTNPIASSMILFDASGVITTATSSVQTLAPVIFQSAFTVEANNVDAGTLSATVIPTAFASIPTYRTTGASGSYTITEARAMSSDLKMSTNNSDGDITITLYNDIDLRDSALSGAGTETLTTRNYIRMADETNAVNFNGILSTIASGNDKLFINHEGTAASVHTGNFEVIDTVQAGRVESGLGVFYTSLTVADEAYDATNWNGSLEVPTKNALRDKIETLGGGSGDQLFYLTVKHSDDTAAFRDVNLLAFNVDNFYLTQNSPNTDEAIINLRGVIDEASSPIWSGQHTFDSFGPIIDVTTAEAFLVRQNSDGGDVFKVDTTDRIVTVGDGAATDSVLEFHDTGVLAWSIGFVVVVYVPMSTIILILGRTLSMLTLGACCINR